MRKATQLKKLIEAPEILVMPAVYDGISSRIAVDCGFKALQCSGLAIAASLGLPDVSIVSMREMADRTRAIVDSVDVPVMGDGDTGYGNAVNAWFTVQAFEQAGAAGINLEDQVLPKRCGHLDGKEIVSLEEMALKVAAAVDARSDPHFVINARTDAYSIEGLEGVFRRCNSYLEAGATMVFVEGDLTREEIRTLARGLRGPLALNMIEGPNLDGSLDFEVLQELGVARVSLSVTALLGAMKGIRGALEHAYTRRRIKADPDIVADFSAAHALAGMDKALDLEARFVAGKLEK
ncbi:MAG TPA: isocitrate lyase/PEP mutase family protein [Hyphomicrobiaceae bacterium]|nr:isocitrate lyase/PEP mutase family protein [Hyphomicrobiaceae bacterium]